MSELILVTQKMIAGCPGPEPATASHGELLPMPHSLLSTATSCWATLTLVIIV